MEKIPETVQIKKPDVSCDFWQHEQRKTKGNKNKKDEYNGKREGKENEKEKKKGKWNTITEWENNTDWIIVYVRDRLRKWIKEQQAEWAGKSEELTE